MKNNNNIAMGEDKILVHVIKEKMVGGLYLAESNRSETKKCEILQKGSNVFIPRNFDNCLLPHNKGIQVDMSIVDENLYPAEEEYLVIKMEDALLFY